MLVLLYKVLRKENTNTHTNYNKKEACGTQWKKKTFFALLHFQNLKQHDVSWRCASALSYFINIYIVALQFIAQSDGLKFISDKSDRFYLSHLL